MNAGSGGFMADSVFGFSEDLGAEPVKATLIGLPGEGIGAGLDAECLKEMVDVPLILGGDLWKQKAAAARAYVFKVEAVAPDDDFVFVFDSDKGGSGLVSGEEGGDLDADLIQFVGLDGREAGVARAGVYGVVADCFCEGFETAGITDAAPEFVAAAQGDEGAVLLAEPVSQGVIVEGNASSGTDIALKAVTRDAQQHGFFLG
jgi:hypothetical protein